MNEPLSWDWIDPFTQIDKLYEDFYKAENYYIYVTFLYVDPDNQIEKVNKKAHILETNPISKEQVKQWTHPSDTEYEWVSMLQYNHQSSPEDIQKGLPQENTWKVIEKPTTSIYFDKTIQMFQDLNELLFIFRRRRSNP
jgi:hypothetical protein